ncbi:hypothetical protein GDO81_027247 [Engystomops pustulosus]|uniref:Taste receptor type 2 n=1 Tax=Engystomops pustulosus TaxID=76066 RepID=A0AAV6Z478_ENGPU|nr:hypothetical protein GDO81_027247 [Engystomops pustulosus]
MDALTITCIYINLGTLMIAFLENIFIIVVNFLDFCEKRRLPISDQLILGFSVSSLLHGLQKWYILCKCLLNLPRNEYDMKATHVFMYLNLCTLMFSALLSLHFCLKIVNINHRFYIGAQRKCPKLFPWIIIAFPLGFFFLNLFSALEISPECLQNTTFTIIVAIKMSPRCSWSLLFFSTFCILCASFCSVSASTIIFSLFKHMKTIHGNSEGSRSPNMDAHIRAVKTVTSLLAANIFIFISTTILRYILSFPLGILISISHIFSSYFLIKGTKKLDKALAEIVNRCITRRKK